MSIRMGVTGMVLATLALALAPVAAHADALKTGRAFLATREKLLKQGWQPVSPPADADREPIGVEGVLIRAGIAEVESCAMDRAVCLFNYRRGDQCLQVMTSGEVLGAMTVVRWEFRCVEANDR